MVLLLGLVGCGSASMGDEVGFLMADRDRAQPSADAAADIVALANGNNAFGLELFRAVRMLDQNLVCSPYSLSAVLAMTWAGSTGDTEREMAEVLGFDLPQAALHRAFNALDQALVTSGELNIANSLWGEVGYPYNPSFLDLLAEQYGAGLGLVDFEKAEEARKTINQWVSDKTKGRIPEFAPSGAFEPEEPWLVLVDAVYFKASWQLPFAEEKTRDLQFFLLDGTSVTVPMMDQRDVFPKGLGESYQAVELPYKGGRFAMLLILPAEGALEDLVAGLDEAALAAMIDGLEPGAITVKMPRFSFSSTPPVEDGLRTLGMTKMFELGSDFFPMIDLQADAPIPAGLGVSGVHQKAFMTVGEMGTEAAATTSVTMTGGVSMEKQDEIILNRPFLYVIRDLESGQIVFLGQVMNPAEAAASG
jgi:serpin B